MNDSYEQQIMGSIRSAIERDEIEEIYGIMRGDRDTTLRYLDRLNDVGIIDLNKDPWKNMHITSY
jgi:hypothetical protein